MSNKKPYERNNKTYNKKDNNYYKNNYKGNYHNNNYKNNKTTNEDAPKVRMDQERINDIDTLDTSFLEGRITSKKSKVVKEKLLKEDKRHSFAFVKYVIIVIVVIGLFVGLCFYLGKVVKSLEKEKPKVEEKTKVSPSPSIDVDMDNNYLFIGTYNTNRLDFNEDYHYIKVSEDFYNTNHILNEMNTQVYQYNPTYVFIELGINELYVEEPNEDFVIRLSKIIEGIKKNRPKAQIYVESIYPINRTVEGHDNELIADYIDNELIRTVNKDIKKMVEEKEVNYLDLYSLLIEDGNLIKDYTDNGIYLNDRGLKVVYDEINKIIG